MQPSELGIGCGGVDLNRNFGFHWRDVLTPLHIQGGSDLPCTETYAGPSAWSEPESRALRDFILEHKNTIVVSSMKKGPSHAAGCNDIYCRGKGEEEKEESRCSRSFHSR